MAIIRVKPLEYQGGRKLELRSVDEELFAAVL